MLRARGGRAGGGRLVSRETSGFVTGQLLQQRDSQAEVLVGDIGSKVGRLQSHGTTRIPRTHRRLTKQPGIARCHITAWVLADSRQQSCET